MPVFCFLVADSVFRSFITRQKKCKIDDNLQHGRLKMLHQCLEEIESTAGDEAKCNAAKAACIQCDVIIKMHQQLPKIKDYIQKDHDLENKKGSPKHKKNYYLHSLGRIAQEDKKPIFFIKTAKSSDTKLKETDFESQSLNDNRLEVSQALAEQGDLEPGNPNCKWIRDAFDVEALASQMEETELAELKSAIE
jgi:hypothetical protein